MTRAAINDVTFTDISIKSKGQSDYINIIDNYQASSILGGMSITEGLFHGGLSGFIILNDPNPDEGEDTDDLPSISSLAQAGSMIRFSFSTTDEDNTDHLVDSLEFYVYNVSIVSNMAPGIAKLGSSQAITYRLEFASYESSSLNYQDFSLIKEKDYVGRIDEFFNELASNSGTGLLAPTNEAEGDSPASESGIANTAQIEPEIVPTYNGAWFKRKQSLYPWGKEKKAPSINKLILTSLNYAVPANGFSTDEDSGEVTDRGVPEENNPSYVFYQSLPRGQWHLIPIGGIHGLYGKNLINDPKEGKGFHEYTFTNDQGQYKRVEDFKLIKSGDILELEESGAFGSKYSLIEPNWKGIYNGITEVETSEDDTPTDAQDKKILGSRQNAYYHDFMSLASNLKMEDVVYNYSDFFVKDELSDTDTEEENTSVGPLLGGNLSNGRTNPVFSSLMDPVYGYFDERYLNKPVPTLNDDYASARGQKYMWQTMFDMTDLPLEFNSDTGEIGIRTIVDGYREPYRKAKLAYSVLKDLKEQWNRYRYSICCNAGAPEDFMALIVGYTAANILPYDFETDTNRIDRNITPFGLSGATIENLYRYSFVEVEMWPKALIPKGVSANTFIEGADDTLSYYDYLQSQDVNPSISGPHHIFIPGNSAGNDAGITFSFGLSAESADGQEYKINQEQEFFVIPVESGKQGLFTSYNVNELTNNKAFTNAGINTKGYNYPAGFNLMSIGAMTGGINDETTAIPATYMGTIVGMKALRESNLNEIKTEQDVIEAGSAGGSDGYTGPPGITGNVLMGTIGLLNTIMGSQNLPTTFGGTSFDISYEEVSEDEDTGEEIIVYKSIERDDKADRPDIATDAKPAPRTSSGNDKIVFWFSSENDHDGRCAT